jgi:hypothetical protein
MREQKELPSFPKEYGHQTHNPTWQKNHLSLIPYLEIDCWDSVVGIEI